MYTPPDDQGEVDSWLWWVKALNIFNDDKNSYFSQQPK